MGLWRDRDGVVQEMDDQYAFSQGLEPVEGAERQALIQDTANRELQDERGVVGAINAGATRALSGLSLGASDVGLSALMSDEQRQQLASDIEAHPYVSAAGEIAGAVSGAVLGGGFAGTPSGYLSGATARAAEAGLAEGTALGTAKALGAMGVEGAVQSTGSYIGMSAIEDRDLTAEGLAGAAGLGFAFGAGAGGAFLGIEKGTIAARKLWSKAFDGGEEALQAAKSTWRETSEQAVQAAEDNLAEAKSQLDQIRAAKAQAASERQYADSLVASEKAAPGRAMTADQAAAQRIRSVRGPMADAERFADSAYESLRIPGGTPEAPRGVRPGMWDELDNAIPRAPEFGPIENVGERTQNLVVGPAQRSVAGDVLEETVTPGNTKAMQIDNGVDLIDGVHFTSDDIPYEARGFASGRVMGEELPWEQSFRETSELVGKEAAQKEVRLAQAIEEFEPAKKAFDELYMDPQKLALFESDDILDYMGKGGDFGEFAQKTPFSQVDDVVPDHMPAWSEQDLRKAFAEEGDVAAQRSIAAENEAMGGTRNMKVTTGKRAVKESLEEETHRLAEVITNFEEKLAKLTDAIEDAAHPVTRDLADGFAEASDEATRRTTDRATRAVEDAEKYGPKEMPGKERLGFYKQMKADAKLSESKLAEQELAAKSNFDEKAGVAKGERRKLKELEKSNKAAQKSESKAAKAADYGSVLEIASIPGLPKPSDLPIIGPVLGAYLKLRGIKMAMGKLTGRVTANGEAKAAALAAQTRERIATAVDRALGVAEKNAKKAATTYAPAAAGVIARRIYDDGNPDAPKGASLPEVVATRIRELSAYVNTPNAIELDVRREMRGVADPDLIASTEKLRRWAMEYILQNAPKMPAPSPLNKTQWQPTPGEAMKFTRQLEAANDPASVYEKLSDGKHVALEEADLVKNVYPRLFQIGMQRVLDQSTRMKQSVPYDQRIRMSALFDVPLDASLDPDNMRILKSVHVRTTVTNGPATPAPPTPSVAGTPSVTALFQTAADRRSQR